MNAVAFTTHPANDDWGGGTPRYWTGYGTMPRAIQVKNVVISLYDVDTTTTLYVPNQPLYSHASFDKSQFDEGETNDDPEHQDLGDHDIMAKGEKTVWICELGSTSDFADFAAFKAAVLGAALNVDAEALTVDYDSPSQGRLVMAWDGPLTQDGIPVEVSDYPRYENPYSVSPFRDDIISFEYKDPSGEYESRFLVLDFANRTRNVSHFLD